MKKMTAISSLFKIRSYKDQTDNLVILIALSSVLWYVWLYVKSKRKQQHPLPPGPWGLPIFGNLPFLQPEIHTYLQGLAEKHGPVFKLRLGSTLVVVITSPEAAREVLRTNDAIFANHDIPALAPVNTYGGIGITWSPYGPKWRMLRKVCTHNLLSKATLDLSFVLRRRETRRTVRYLADRARVGSSVNLGEQIFKMISSVLTQMLWGARVEREESEILGVEFIELITKMNDLLMMPNISDFFPALSRFDLQGFVKRMEVHSQKMDRLFDRIINHRLGMERNGEDFLEVLLKIKDEEKDFTMNDVKALLMDMVIAGSDTSLHVIEFAMAELLNKPEIINKAQQELDKVVGKEKVVEESHISKLPYILAIMKETLRLHPIVPLLVPRRPTQTTVVGGFTIPKDSKVLFNAWAIHRNPDVWNNPLKFDPERFLDESSSYDFNGNDFNYIPFGSGRRSCVGMAMGERVVLYNVATLLHSFDWKLPQGEKVSLEEKFGATLKLKNPLVATPVLRFSNPNLYL